VLILQYGTCLTTIRIKKLEEDSENRFSIHGRNAPVYTLFAVNGPNFFFSRNPVS